MKPTLTPSKKRRTPSITTYPMWYSDLNVINTTVEGENYTCGTVGRLPSHQVDDVMYRNLWSSEVAFTGRSTLVLFNTGTTGLAYRSVLHFDVRRLCKLAGIMDEGRGYRYETNGNTK